MDIKQSKPIDIIPLDISSNEKPKSPIQLSTLNISKSPIQTEKHITKSPNDMKDILFGLNYII
jgi:hypothetical protein